MEEDETYEHEPPEYWGFSNNPCNDSDGWLDEKRDWEDMCND